MNLISLKDGTYINPEHVVQFTPMRNGETRFLLSTGDEKFGEPWSKEIPEMFFPTFPANPGFIAIFAARRNDGGFSYTPRSVIAWQRYGLGNFPVFEGVTNDDDYEVMIDPAGGVFDSDGNMFESIDDWKRYFEEEFGSSPVTQAA